VRRVAAGLGLLAFVALAAVAARFLCGATGFGFPAPEAFRYRAFAAGSGAAVGACLGLAGLFLQALLRNPLASPFILGISGGASLGYVLSLYLAWRFGSETVGILGPVPSATLGALVSMFVVWRLGTRDGAIDPLTLVLAGAVTGAIAGALTMAVQSLAPGGVRADLVAWLLGRIPEAPSPWLLALVAGLAGLGLVVGLACARALDAATLSDDEASSLGLSLPRLRLALFVLACTLTAATVALAGPIAFVGLVAPHAARLALGARHGPLVPGAALAGVAILVGADAARQSVDLGAGRMPVGVVTAFLGGTAFLVLLRRARWNA